jgi:hypothetical protein
MKKLTLLVLCVVAFGLNGHAKNKPVKIDIYCETGDPGGGGPGLTIDGKEVGAVVTADVELSINSEDPEYGTADLHILKTDLTGAKAMVLNSWIFDLGAGYMVELSRDEDDYYAATVISKDGKFSPIPLSCQ